MSLWDRARVAGVHPGIARDPTSELGEVSSAKPSGTGKDWTLMADPGATSRVLRAPDAPLTLTQKDARIAGNPATWGDR
jgi:hypothetical protein